MSDRTHRVSKVRRNWTETPTKRKNESPERDFRDSLRKIAPLYGCELIAIPDFIHAKGNKIVAHKRPCDDILSTSHGNYFIEAKYQYGKQKDHQIETERKINSVNQSYYVIRKIRYKAVRVMYHIEQNGKKIFKTGDIQKIFEFFKDPTEHYSQCIMMDSMLHSKKRKLRKVRV